MESITIDGQGEEDFRRSIETMLRRGQADAAAARLRALIEPYAGSIVPARFRTVTAADVVLAGWSDLAHRIGEHDRPGHRISAVEITAGAGDPQSGHPSPHVETRYFSDEAYPFSEASRRELLRGYGAAGGVWQGHPEGGDTSLVLEGIDDLYDAVARLEAQLMSSPDPGEHDIRAGSIGACYLAVLAHQAVENAIDRGGLPRPLCVLAGTGEVYPYFDAPVVSAPECREAGLGASVPIALPAALAEAGVVEEEEDEEEAGLHADDEHSGRTQNYGSLLSLGASIRVKQPVITVDATEAAAASHHYELGAQHRLTIAGNSDRIGVLPGLAPADENEDVPVPADHAWIEPEVCGACADTSPEPRYAPDEASSPRPAALVDEAPHPAPALAPIVAEATNAMAETAPGNVREQDAIAAIPDESTPDEAGGAVDPPPPPKGIPAPAAHSLRSRVVQRQTRRVTVGDRILAFIQHTARWLGGFRR